MRKKRDLGKDKLSLQEIEYHSTQCNSCWYLNMICRINHILYNMSCQPEGICEYHMFSRGYQFRSCHLHMDIQVGFHVHLHRSSRLWKKIDKFHICQHKGLVHRLFTKRMLDHNTMGHISKSAEIFFPPSKQCNCQLH